MLRLLTENVCGELTLPDYAPGKGGVVYLCASNAVEWAAGGQEIQAPMANRLWHGEFPMDHDTWCDMMVSDFPAPSDLPVLPADYLPKHHHAQRATIAAYVKAAGRDAWMAPPDDPAEICLRFAVHTATRAEAEAARREITHVWGLGAVGTAFGSPMRPREVIALWPTLVPRDAVQPHVRVSMLEAGR